MGKEMVGNEEKEPPGTLPDLGDSGPESEIKKSHLFVVWNQESNNTSTGNSSEKTLAFRKQFFNAVSDSEWNNWHWQLRHRITRLQELDRYLCLSDEELKAFSGRRPIFPVAITPYFMSLLDKSNTRQGLRRTVVPVSGEHLHAPEESEDPLCEENDTPVHGLVHRYPDRVLFLVTDFCSTYCRYCTRSRMVGNRYSHRFNPSRWQSGLDYIGATPSVRDVLLSGGDPLTLSDDRLNWLLSRLRRIPHVEIIRIGTKVPVVLPQRITPALVRMLKRYHPLWMSIHFTHPDELTPESASACQRLADNGIPLGSQTVLLTNVNDDVATMKRLFHGLMKIRVKPYYLYQCDPIFGSGHFRTPVAKGLEIIKGLRGHTSGYAVPTYVIDGPGGAGKIPLLPDYLVGRQHDDWLLQNYQGRICRYPDVSGKRAAHIPACPPSLS